MRANLLSLQSTQSLLDQTQLRLATGNKVNSALDNPVNFFAAQGLNNRASDLSALLDGMGQSIQVLKTTDQAITSLTKYVNQLKSIANSAKGALGNATSSQSVTGDLSLTALQQDDLTAAVHSLTGGVQNLNATDDLENNLSLTVGTEISFTHGSDTPVTYTVASGDTVQDMIDAVNTAAAGTFTLSLSNDGEIVVTSSDTDDVAITDDNSNADIGLLGIDDGSGGNGTTAAGAASFADGDDFTITVAGGSPISVTITAGMSAQDLVDAINTAGAGAFTASLEDDEDNAGQVFLKISGSGTDALTIADGGQGTAASTFGVDGTTTLTQNLDAVEALQNSYANVIAQITQTAKDASYQGSNLIDGASADLTVQVNERSSTPISVANQDLTAVSGLGLTATVTWTTTTAIDATIAKVSEALDTLRSASNSFANNLSLLQTRQDFTKNLVATLTDGASQLTIADKNEEGANLLALQTSQQLGIQALALSSQANQSVLRLFS